jgi:multiple sugar transport system ATP-binding protein
LDAFFGHAVGCFQTKAEAALYWRPVQESIGPDDRCGSTALPFLDLPLDHRPTAKVYPPGSELLVGIRPHDLAPAREPRRGPSFRGRVRLTEPLGDVTVIDVGVDDLVMKIVLPEELALAYDVGSDIDVEVPLADTHLFLRETGVAIR